MKRILLYFISLPILLVVLLNSNASAQRELKYTLNPIFEADLLRFRVDLYCKGETTGTTTLVLPNRWGGQPNLYKSIQNLQVVSRDAKLTDTAEPNIKIITHRPNQILHIQYDLAQDFPGLPQGASRDYYRPILQKDYFHWIGHGAWIHPQWNENETVRVSLEWKNLPKDWTLANSFGANRKNQSFQTTLEEFIHSVFVGGNFRIQAIPVGGKSIYTAVRGSWQFSDSEFAEMVRKIIKVEREFWRDNSVPYYLVTLLPLEAAPNAVNTGGTGLTNSFANFATRNAELDRFKYLLAHEYFHNWNSPKLGRLKEPETLLYWFSEGFTDYYAYLLLLRGGLITLDEYLKQNNRLVREYYLSPVRNANNPRVLQDFWNDDDVHDLPYRRGLLLAANWNAMIRSASGGKNTLDDAMLDMFDSARQNKPELTAELINENISRYTKQSILPDVQRFIENGELITLDKNAFGHYVEMEIMEVPLFELGLDLEVLRNKKVIAGVVEDSAAYCAGLRNGQIVLRRLPIYVGDVTKLVEITIKEDTGERVVKYYPASQKKVSVPQFKLRSGITDQERAETLRRLGVSFIQP